MFNEILAELEWHIVRPPSTAGRQDLAAMARAARARVDETTRNDNACGNRKLSLDHFQISNRRVGHDVAQFDRSRALRRHANFSHLKMKAKIW